MLFPDRFLDPETIAELKILLERLAVEGLSPVVLNSGTGLICDIPLDPDLDLWQTAKPFLERWMSEQIGWRGLVRRVGEEIPFWSELLPQLPRLAKQFLARDHETELRAQLELLVKVQQRNSRLLAVAVGLLAALLIAIVAF